MNNVASNQDYSSRPPAEANTDAPSSAVAWDKSYRHFTDQVGSHPPVGVFYWHPLIQRVADDLIDRRAVHPRLVYDEAHVVHQAAHILSQIVTDSSAVPFAECASADDWACDAADLTADILRERAAPVDQRCFRPRAWLVRQQKYIAELLRLPDVVSAFIPDVSKYRNDYAWSH